MLGIKKNTVVTVIIWEIIGNMLMDIIYYKFTNYLTGIGLTEQHLWNFVAVTIAYFFFMILTDYIKNEPEYEFRLKDDDKPQFLKREREPHFSLPQLEEMVRQQEKEENLWGTYNKLLEKASS